MSLVPDIKQWKRWWSMRLIIATVLLQSVSIAYAALPNDWLPTIPDYIKLSLAISVLTTAGAAGVARVINQKNINPGD